MALATHVTVSLALRTEIAPYVFKFQVNATAPEKWLIAFPGLAFFPRSSLQPPSLPRPRPRGLLRCQEDSPSPNMPRFISLYSELKTSMSGKANMKPYWLFL